MKIIANVISLDSEPELPNLLASLKGKIDALVLVDGGSADKTVEIAETWGRESGTPVVAQVNPWPDDFALQRNVCLNLTREKFGVSTGIEPVWILMIDTDDTLAEFDRPFLEQAIANNDLGGIACRMDNGNGFFHCAQFFKLTHGAIWKNPIHEYIHVEGTKALPPVEQPKDADGNPVGQPVGKLTIKRGRSKRHDRDPLRNVRIGRRFVEVEPKDSRGRFYLARDLIECEAVAPVQRVAEAEGHLRAYLAMETGFVTQDRYVLLLLVRILCDTGRVAEAKKLLTDWIVKDPDNRSAHEALARIVPGAEGQVWRRLSAAAEGSCVLPYANKLPNM